MIKAAIALIALACAASANAVTIYQGVLSGGQETVPNASTATGFGEAILSNDGLSLSVTISWTGLVQPAVAAHIHCCALLGANAPVALDLSPSAAISGSASGVFDLTSLSSYGGGFLGANNNNAETARMALIAGLDSGKAYFNIHNATFPGGEIRGQIAAVPEPASWALMIAGFGLVGGALRQSRRQQSAA